MQVVYIPELKDSWVVSQQTCIIMKLIEHHSDNNTVY